MIYLTASLTQTALSTGTLDAVNAAETPIGTSAAGADDSRAIFRYPRQLDLNQTATSSSPSSPSSSTPTGSTAATTAGPTSHAAAIAIGVAGGAVVILAVSILAIFSYRRRNADPGEHGLYIEASAASPAHSSAQKRSKGSDRTGPGPIDQVMTAAGMIVDQPQSGSSRPGEGSTIWSNSGEGRTTVGGGGAQSPLAGKDEIEMVPPAMWKGNDDGGEGGIPPLAIDTAVPRPQSWEVFDGSEAHLTRPDAVASPNSRRGARKASYASMHSHRTTGSRAPGSPTSQTSPQISLPVSDIGRLTSQQLLLIHGLVRRGVGGEAIATAVRQMLAERDAEAEAAAAEEEFDRNMDTRLEDTTASRTREATSGT